MSLGDAGLTVRGEPTADFSSDQRYSAALPTRLPAIHRVPPLNRGKFSLAKYSQVARTTPISVLPTRAVATIYV